jgi:hypothetical protein
MTSTNTDDLGSALRALTFLVSVDMLPQLGSPVRYNLIRLAPGSYDVFLDGVVVASLVQVRHVPPVWVAELLLDLSIGERPAPFKRLEHTFS